VIERLEVKAFHTHFVRIAGMNKPGVAIVLRLTDVVTWRGDVVQLLPRKLCRKLGENSLFGHDFSKS